MADAAYSGASGAADQGGLSGDAAGSAADAADANTPTIDLVPDFSTDVGEKAEDHGVQHLTGYGYLPVGDDAETCAAKARAAGGYAWDAHAQACWPIFGKVIIIGRNEASIEEGFQITNFNFHVNGNQPAVPSQKDLPGAGQGGSQVNGAPPGTIMNPGGVFNPTA